MLSENTQHRKRITVWLVPSLTRLNLPKEESILFIVCSEVNNSNLVKMETSRTLILPTHGECSPVSPSFEFHLSVHLVFSDLFSLKRDPDDVDVDEDNEDDDDVVDVGHLRMSTTNLLTTSGKCHKTFLGGNLDFPLN